MDIGLFDLYTNGHHLPYAARIKRAIESTPDINAKFITLSEIPRCRDLFNREDIVYLDDPNSPCIENRNGTFDEIAEDAIKEFFSKEDIYRFDVLHFLFSDDILGPLYRHSPDSSGPRLIGELNGAFFERKLPLRRQYSHPSFLALLQSPIGGLIDSLVPKHTDHEQLWRDLFLYRCLNEDTFDFLITHSDEAVEYVSKLDPHQGMSVKQVPYPVPENFGTEISQQEARKQLDLPSGNPILLFFGTLHEKKGIHNLIDVLGRYNGPEFTMHIAGPPIDVTREEVISLKNISTINIIAELNYIDNPELYYRAADAIVLPYTREFGIECTSQTLKEAISALLPVIVPDFGAVGRVTKEWNLGMTYNQGSYKSLETALLKFAQEGIPYSEEQMRRYTRVHSYEQAATKLLSVYSASLNHQTTNE